LVSPSFNKVAVFRPTLLYLQLPKVPLSPYSIFTCPRCHPTPRSRWNSASPYSSLARGATAHTSLLMALAKGAIFQHALVSLAALGQGASHTSFSNFTCPRCPSTPRSSCTAPVRQFSSFNTPGSTYSYSNATLSIHFQLHGTCVTPTIDPTSDRRRQLAPFVRAPQIAKAFDNYLPEGNRTPGG
jgi:hypothetical protein